VKKLQARIQEFDHEDDSDPEEDDDVEEPFEENHSRDEDDRGYDPNVNYDHISGIISGTGNELRRRGGGETVEMVYSAGIQSTGRPNPHSNDGLDNHEKTLMTERVEHEQLMNSLLSLTRELKNTASMFNGSLESEKNMVWMPQASGWACCDA